MEFGSKHDTDVEYQQIARQKCKDIIYWIYLAIKDDSAIKSIPITVNKSSRIQEKLNEVSRSCIESSEKESVKIPRL